MKLKMITIFMALCFAGSLATAQEDKSNRTSPPATAEGDVDGAHITINYSQPSVKGRKIYGGLVPYDKVWRTGANEATTFKTDKDLMIEGKKLKAGKYSLFTIPGKDEWTIIFNRELGLWGAYDYDSSKDVLRIKVNPRKNSMTEKMKFIITDEGVIQLDWAKTRVPFQLKA